MSRWHPCVNGLLISVIRLIRGRFLPFALRRNPVCRDSSNLNVLLAFVSPLAYRPTSVATRHSSSGKPFGSALAAPSVHRQVDEIRRNRLLFGHHVSVRCFELRTIFQNDFFIQLCKQIIFHCLLRLFNVFLCHSVMPFLILENEKSLR